MMDKQSPETIKIKINGKERSVTNTEESTHEMPISSWNEKLPAKDEIATAKQPVEEDDFPWLLPDENLSDVEDDPKVVIPKKKTLFVNKNDSLNPYIKTIGRSIPYKRFATIFFLAVGLGVLFGYIALSFLSNDDMPETSKTAAFMQGTDSAHVNDESNGNTTSPPTEQKASNASLQLYAVQAGIFSERSGADSLATDISQKGLAATVLENNGSYSVLVGVGKEKTETTELNDVYQNNKYTEFWAGKQLSLTIATESAAEQWASVIKELSSIAASTVAGRNVNQEKVSNLETSIKALTGKDEKEKELIAKLLLATVSIKNNRGWEAQQHLLDVIKNITTT